MAKKAQSKFPTLNILFSVKVGDEYKQLKTTIGLWPAEKGPMARGGLQGERLDKVAAFLSKAAEKKLSVSVSLFKNEQKKNNDIDEFGSSNKDSDEFDL